MPRGSYYEAKLLLNPVGISKQSRATNTIILAFFCVFINVSPKGGILVIFVFFYGKLDEVIFSSRVQRITSLSLAFDLAQTSLKKLHFTEKSSAHRLEFSVCSLYGCERETEPRNSCFAD